MIGMLLLIIITLFLPPLGVFLMAGCGADLLINICLTILGFLPGHVHAFYLEYQYHKRKEVLKSGGMLPAPAPGVYSSKINQGTV